MATKAAGALIGAIFGVMLCWTGMSNPDVIRQALLFDSSYLYLFMGAAVGTAAIGLRVLRARRERAVLTDAKLTFTQEPPQRRHVVGALIFGTGWGIANVCPGPILAQVGQGMGWGFLTLAGALIGVRLYLKQGAKETEPAADTTSASAEALPVSG
jgi:uncharacterized membrane protein YedE/YeeE